MSRKVWLWSFISIVLVISLTVPSCAMKNPPIKVKYEVDPPIGGNSVDIFIIEMIDKEGNLQTYPTHQIQNGHVTSVMNVKEPRTFKKLHIIATPGKGYRFDRWSGDASGTVDNFTLEFSKFSEHVLNSGLIIKAHFVPIGSTEDPSEWDTPEPTQTVSVVDPSELVPPLIPAARITSMAVPDYGISQAQLDAYPGAIPFNVILIVDPLQAEDLSAEGLEFNYNGDRWVFESTDGSTPSVEPVVVDFGFFSDGYAYPEEKIVFETCPGMPHDLTEDDNSIICKLLRGDPDNLVYEGWAKKPGDYGSEDSAPNCLHNTSTIDSSTTSDILEDPTTSAYVRFASEEVDEDEETLASIIAHDGLMLWNFDPLDPPEQEWILSNTVFSIDSAPTATVRLNREELDELENFWETECVPFTAAVDIIPSEGVFTFVTDKDIQLGNASLYEGYFVASVADKGAVSEATDGITTLYGFSSLATFVDDDPGGGDCDEKAEIGTFGFVSDGLCYSTVYGIPVDTMSLFTPSEPHVIVLPYTFWTYLEPPPDFLETETYNLKVHVSPGRGGHVQLSTREGIKPHDEGPEGTWDTTMTYDWFFDENHEVTLTAIPAEGWRFVRWVDEFNTRIENPTSPVLKLDIKPPHICTESLSFSEVRAYFAQAEEEPEDAIPTPTPTPEPTFTPAPEPLTVSFPLNVDGGPQCGEQGACTGVLDLDLGASLSGGDETVTITGLELKVNGDVAGSWPVPNLTSVSIQGQVGVPCNAEYSVQVGAQTSDGAWHWSETDTGFIPNPCEPPPPPPPPPPLQTSISLGIGAQCGCSGPEGGPYECGCTATVSYSVHLTGGTGEETITSVVLTVNGANWKTSNGVGSRDFYHSEVKPADCNETLNAVVTVTLSDRSVHDNSGSFTTPNPCPE